MHPVQRHDSNGTVETSLASRIALGNTGETCSPAVVFLTESGKKHIHEIKRHHNKTAKKTKSKSKPKVKVSQSDSMNSTINVERQQPSFQSANVVFANSTTEQFSSGQGVDWVRFDIKKKVK